MYSKRGTIVKHTPYNESLYLSTKWASEISKLNTEQQILAKKAINDILFEAKMKTLDLNSIKVNSCSTSDGRDQCNEDHMDCESERCRINVDSKKRKRKIWMNECFKRRTNSVDENPNNLIDTVTLDYENIFKMKPSTFEELLESVTPFIKKSDTLMRDAIPPRQRLAATLHFLVSGKMLQDLKEITNIAPQTLGNMIIETCEAIVGVLNDYIQTPQTSEEWLEISKDIENQWDFPHCLGAIGGVHIKVPKVQLSDTCQTHKNRCIAVMLAITDSKYKFTLIDVRPNIQYEVEEETSNKTNYNERIFGKIQNLPGPGEISNTNYKFPYVFVTDSVLDLSDKIMKPYTRRLLSKEQLVYNFRLNRVNRSVENAIGMMSSQFRILLNSIRYNSIDKSIKVIRACCYLHNYLLTKNENAYKENQIDAEDISTGLTHYAKWRLDDDQLIQIRCNQSNKNPYSSILIRNKFCEYFNGVGSLPYQHLFISQL